MVGTFRPETMRDDPYPPYSRRPGDMLALDDRFDTPDATDPDFWPLGVAGTPIGEVPERPRGLRWGRWNKRGLGVGHIGQGPCRARVDKEDVISVDVVSL